MAEPMSSNEIEDVLSSIRRLVAQDLKPADRAKLAAVAQATQKLVLAPELRVEDQPATFATVRRPSRRAAFPPVDAVLAGVAALVGKGNVSQDSQSGRQPDPAHRDLPQQHFALGAQALADDLAAREAESVTLSAFMAAEAQGSIDPVPDTWPSTPLTEDIAEMARSLHSVYGEDDTPYSQGEDGTFTIDPDARLFDAAPELAAQIAPDQTDDLAPAWVDGEPAAYAESDSAVSDTAEESQSLSGTIEPDADWADAAERRVIAELAGEAVEEDVFEQVRETFREPKFSAAGPQTPPEVLFDEDVLRAMVQAIFREEIAGPMGERITRNIRKLVRAEVGRILAAQELE
jgi:hypothetical protein